MSNTITIAEVLGMYVAQADLTIVPSVVLDKLKLCVLDSLGCMIGGSTLEPGRLFASMVRAWGGTPQSTIPGLDVKVPAPWAAYVNGYLANLLDFDDTTPLGHPGSTVVPTALAMGERHRCSGRDVLLALLVGYEISLRVAAAIRPSPEREPHVRGMGTWQIFGAAATAASLLRLNASQAAHSLALAVNHAPVPSMKKFGYRDRPISCIKNNLGWANLGGILAAELAAQGMTANLTNFDGASGFWVMAGSDRPDSIAYTRELGQTYYVMDVAFKPYSACWGPHTTLDAISSLVQHHDIQAKRVRRVVVFGPQKLMDYSDRVPQSVPDAQFSIPYLAALLLLREPPGYAWFRQTSMNSTEIAALASKVEIVCDDTTPADYRKPGIPVRVQIELEDGHVLEEIAEVAPGAPQRPLSAEKVTAKFLSLAEPVLGTPAAQQLLGLVDNLEQLDDTARLAELFGKEGG